jgi:hypothetical protein
LADGFSSKKKAAVFDIITTPDLSGLVDLRNMPCNRKKIQSIQPNKPKLIIQPQSSIAGNVGSGMHRIPAKGK